MISKRTIFHRKDAVVFSLLCVLCQGKHATDQLLILKLCGADFFFVSMWVMSVCVCVCLCVLCE